MGSGSSFFYKSTMKDSRKNFKSMGISLFLFMILFGILKSLVFVPLLGKIWGLTLRTTPEGFISNGNLIDVIVKSPWVILIGILLIVFFAIFAMWQVSAMLVGISYMRHGRKIKFGDLLRLSVSKLSIGLKARNWMLLVYSLIIVPFADIYQTNSMIKAFAVPEYIIDFIVTKPILFAVFLVLVLLVIYIALRWLFLLPSFILKSHDFRVAKAESSALTSKCWLKTGVNTVLYSLIELVRLSIIPMAVIMLPVFFCYLFTKNSEFSAGIYSAVGISLGLEMVKITTGAIVQLGVTYFLVELYFTRLSELGLDAPAPLPELKQAAKSKIRIYRLLIACACIFAILLASAYLVALKLCQNGSDAILDLIGITDIIAHKGYSSKAPENTIPAFDLAAGCDAVDYIELDVWSTKDGVPVVIHNSDINDATGVDKYVYECTYDELKDLPAPYGMSQQDFPNARIPSLEEVIKKYAGTVPLLIEIKGYGQDPQLPAKIIELMRKYDSEYYNVIQSNDYGAIRAVKKIDSKIECGLIIAIVTGNYYDLPYADFFSVEQSFVDHDTVSALHKRGKELYVWTVNQVKDANSLKLCGVDGIITDYPEDMAQCVADTNELADSIFQRNIAKHLNSDHGRYALEKFAEGAY